MRIIFRNYSLNVWLSNDFGFCYLLLLIHINHNLLLSLLIESLLYYHREPYEYNLFQRERSL